VIRRITAAWDDKPFRIEKVAGSIPAGSTGFSQLKGWILTQGT